MYVTYVTAIKIVTRQSQWLTIKKIKLERRYFDALKHYGAINSAIERAMSGRGIYRVEDGWQATWRFFKQSLACRVYWWVAVGIVSFSSVVFDSFTLTLGQATRSRPFNVFGERCET